MLCVVLLMSASCTITSFTSFEKKASSGIKYSETIYDEAFKDIRACSSFDITLHKSNKYMVNIEVSEELRDYLDVEINNGMLALSFDEAESVFRQYAGLEAHADIYLPSFEKIDLSAASSVHTADTFMLDNVCLYVSGASDIENLNMIARDVDVRSSGASNVKAKVYADKMYMRISGASNVTLKPISEKTGKNLDIDLSGASDADMSELPFEDIVINGSGSSSASVFPVKTLGGSVSGASDVEYKCNKNNVKVDVTKSGASSVKEK